MKSFVPINNFFVKLSSVLFICDTPARSYIQCIKGHSGYNGCGYCRQKGEYFNGHMTFPNTADDLRTDVNYENCEETNQDRNNMSPLLKIVPFFSCFPPEYMHSVCLGVTRKLLHYYFLPTEGIHLPCKLSVQQKSVLNEKILSLKKFVPKEFCRKLRPFTELMHFKASEFRLNVLYVGPFLFKEVLPVDFFNHFVLLHFAMYIFCSPKLCRSPEYFDAAEACIKRFVFDISGLFTQSAYVYNVHVLRISVEHSSETFDERSLRARFKFLLE